MKKLTIVLAAALSIAVFASCTKAPTSSTPPSSSPQSSSVSSPKTENVEGTLEELMEKLYKDVKAEMPATMNTPVTEDMSVSFTGVELSKYKEALASDAMINAQAHSVVLIRANSADDAAALAKDVEAGADARKWICVEAEKKIVDVKGDLVVLIMTYADAATEIHENFKNL